MTRFRLRWHFYTVSGEKILDVGQVKAGQVALQKSFTLSKLELDAFCVSSGSQRLAMAVFLVAFDASCLAGRASWMLGIALR